MKVIVLFSCVIAVLLFLLYNEIKKTARLQKEIKIAKRDEELMKSYYQSKEKIQNEKEKQKEKLENAETEKDFFSVANDIVALNNSRMRDKK